MRHVRLGILAMFGVVAFACGGTAEDAESSEDEVRARFAGMTEGSDQACAVLRIANEASAEDLDRGVGLDKRAADGIVAFRAGADGKLGTDDDQWFPKLSELEKINYVKSAAFKKLKDHAAAKPDFACGVVDVKLLAFNDFHGNLKPPSGSSGKITTGPNAATDFKECGGSEYFATHIKTLKAQNPNSLVVAAGDIIGATPLLSALF